MDISESSRQPTSAIKSLCTNKLLIRQFVRRDVLAKYRSSFLGILWSLLVPLVMLALYSFVFTFVFNARFSQMGIGIEGEFPIILFSGLIIHSLLADCLNAAPSLIVSNANLVKKVIFPLEILAPAAVFTALVQFIVSFGVLVIGCLFIYGSIPWTVIFVPIILLPYIILIIGIVWFVSGLGVFIRDIAHVVGVLSTILLFISTVFFPASTLPESFQWLVYANPISFIIDELRKVIIIGDLPDWSLLVVYSLISVAIFMFGYWWFMRVRRAFGDVL